MMKLTVAFLAALATADASHGRRHQARQYGGGYEYGGGYGTGVSSSAAPSTTASPEEASSSSSSIEYASSVVAESTTAEPVATSSSTTAFGGGYGDESSSVVVESSTAEPVETSSSSLGESFPTYSGPLDTTVYPTGTGTGVSVYPSTTAGAEEVPSSSSSVVYSGTGVTEYPTGTGSTAYPSVTDKANSTGLPEVYTTTIYSTQIYTTTISSTISLITSVVPIPSVCTKGHESSTALPVVSSGASAVVVESTVPVDTLTHTVTSYYTITVGKGPSAHPVVSTVVTESTETVYSTIYITKPVVAEATTTAAPEATYPEGTTTVSSTSTTTLYITVTGVHTSAGAEGSGVPVPTGGEGEGEGEGCAPPVTVTVTAQETVTVTAGYDSTSALPEDVTTTIIYTPTSTAEATYTPPFPVYNSTASYTGGSTGFLTYTKPYPTEGYPVESSSASIPQIASSVSLSVIPGEVPTTTASPEEATSSSAASTPTGGYGGGYGYGRFRLF